MNCKKCGAENVDGAKFCCKCGSPLDTPEKNTKINFSDINVEKILSNDKIPKQVKDIINKIMQLPRKVLIGAVAGIVVLIVLIGAVRSHGRTIDLNKYLTINTSGYNGYGSVTAEVDWDSFEEKYDSKISYKKKNLLNKLERFLWDDRSPMNFLEGNVSVSIENDGTYFSNGDKVAYTWNVSDDLQGALNYKLKYKDGTIKVSGLEDAKKVDVFDDVSVDFEGQEPEGTATMTYQGNELDDSYFQYEPSEGLSNGDKVTVTLSEEGVASLTRDYGEVPEETEKEYTVSGTTNYMLYKMSTENCDFDTVLKEAQAKGYAEADPTADVGGADACRKIAILSSLAYGKFLNYEDIYTEGIAKITPADMEYAKELGMTIKLLATSRRIGDSFYAMVAPFLVGQSSPLYSVNDVFNAVFVHGNVLGDAMFYGSGAGKLPTASAVVADVVDEAKHLHRNIMTNWSSYALKLMDMDEVEGRFFVRVSDTTMDEVEKAFGDVQTIEPDDLPDEFGFITPVMKQAEYYEKISKLTGKVLAMIRVKD